MVLIASLSVGFYEGWRIHRAEVAELIAVEIGVPTMTRPTTGFGNAAGAAVADITPITLAAPGHRTARLPINANPGRPHGAGTTHQRLTL